MLSLYRTTITNIQKMETITINETPVMSETVFNNLLKNKEVVNGSLEHTVLKFTYGEYIIEVSRFDYEDVEVDSFGIDGAFEFISFEPQQGQLDVLEGLIEEARAEANEGGCDDREEQGILTYGY